MPKIKAKALHAPSPVASGVLPVCRCIFTAGELQIKPPCPPASQIPSFVQAKRRLYLTATLADDSVLVTGTDVPAD